MDKFAIIKINTSPDSLEQLGTKEKFWFTYKITNTYLSTQKASLVSIGLKSARKRSVKYLEFRMLHTI